LANGAYSRTFWATVCAAVILALIVVTLGAYVRLSDAGLGCPDWPGCYGQIAGVPLAQDEVARANAAFPQRPVDASKAIKEMVHRYFAGALGILVLAIAALAIRNRHRPHQPVLLPLALLLLIILQALLGMWTVTLQLKPVVVMAHLLGGLATLSALWWLFLSGCSWAKPQLGEDAIRYRGLVKLGALILVCQIALGGWTSANYATAACPDFPTCQAQWWPRMNFYEGFVLWRGLGVDYEHGVLDNPARTAIQVTHRIGALITMVYLLALTSMLALRVRNAPVRRAAVLAMVLTVLQVSLGITNVLVGWPLSMAWAHHAAAALLLLTILTLNHMLWPAVVQATPENASLFAEHKGLGHVHI
jgi:cytochrome c oxidase assembly protein subunit 15